MAKTSVIKGLAGCLAMMVLVIAGEALVVGICVKVFDMDEAATFGVVFAMCFIVVVIAACFKSDRKRPTYKNKQRHSPPAIDDSLHCPYCYGINTLMDDEGCCTCFDCKTIWKEETR